MKMIYVAGPMSANTRWEVEKNCTKIAQTGLRLMQEGWAVVIPTWLGDLLPVKALIEDREYWEKIIVGSDCELVKRCDAIMMCKGWTKSSGARQEWETACEANLEILFDEDAEQFADGGVKL